MKQVQFSDDCDKGEEVEIIQSSNKELDTSALGLSCGDLFGEPQTGPVKSDICKLKEKF